eukprot:14563695-Ditylum_brightwellii.AAC.1
MEVRTAGSDVKCCPLEPERWLQRASVPSSTQLQMCIVCTYLWWGGAHDKTAEKAEVHLLPCIPYFTKRMDCQVSGRAKVIKGNWITPFFGTKGHNNMPFCSDFGHHGHRFVRNPACIAALQDMICKTRYSNYKLA